MRHSEIGSMQKFLNGMLNHTDEIGILLTPTYNEESHELRVEYDVIDLEGDGYGPNMRISQEPDPDEDFEKFYRRQCQLVERAFPDAQVQYMDDLEPLIRR